MIPSNILLTQLLPLNELTVQPAAPAAPISDKLSDLIPGQRVLAEIQALLPNGTYRAAVGQRDVTLSLNFSAKPGDKLELEVIENNGRLALTVAGKIRPPDAAPEGVATNLSRTGQLISTLTTSADGKAIQPSATPINKGQPIFNSPILNATTLAPRLQQAIENSGLFYEAHLARWVFGEGINQQQLREEPQGQLSIPLPSGKPGIPSSPPATDNAEPRQANTASPATMKVMVDSNMPLTLAASTPATPTMEHTSTTIVAQELTPLVQQQLASLNNQPLQWQGQLIPGQNFYWEIIKEQSEHSDNPQDAPASWHTKLRLSLPELGDIEARLHIQGVQVGMVLEASDALTREKLVARKDELRKNLAVTGLTLTSIGIAPPPTTPEPLSPESKNDAA